MRILLLHNPTAGARRHAAEALHAALRTAGHVVASRSVKTHGLDRVLERALDRGADLAVAAGGDGTVAEMARALAGRDVPLAILPLGTANNIARSLGADRPAAEALAAVAALDRDRLAAAPRRPLHLGTARAPWGAARFVESVGVGILGALIHDATETARERGRGGRAGRTDRVGAGRARLRRVLAATPPRPRRVEADGEDLSGEYALVEVVGTRYVGPRIPLGPPGGRGPLHLVLADADGCRALDDYLASLLDAAAAEPELPLPVRDVRRVRLTWDRAAGHLDDEPWPAATAGGRPAGAADDDDVVDVGIDDPPVDVLVPRDARAGGRPLTSAAGP